MKILHSIKKYLLGIRKQPHPDGLGRYIEQNYRPFFSETATGSVINLPYEEEMSFEKLPIGSTRPESIPPAEEKASVHEAELYSAKPQHEWRNDKAEDFPSAKAADKPEKRKKFSRPYAAKPVFLVDESFSDRLQRLLCEKDMTAPQCYKRACIDRKLFSKICSNREYRPKKNTVLSLAIALQLNLEETKVFLESAGYALSHSILSDVIVEFYISEGFYDIFEINEVLFAHDQALLGTQ